MKAERSRFDQHGTLKCMYIYRLLRADCAKDFCAITVNTISERSIRRAVQIEANVSARKTAERERRGETDGTRILPRWNCDKNLLLHDLVCDTS